MSAACIGCGDPPTTSIERRPFCGECGDLVTQMPWRLLAAIRAHPLTWKYSAQAPERTKI